MNRICLCTASLYLNEKHMFSFLFASGPCECAFYMMSIPNTPNNLPTKVPSNTRGSGSICAGELVHGLTPTSARLLLVGSGGTMQHQVLTTLSANVPPAPVHVGSGQPIRRELPGFACTFHRDCIVTRC